MTFERTIANRFLSKHSGGFSHNLVRIATWSIALGVVVMIVSVAILRGFQSEIRNKVVGFGSHIIVKSQYIGHNYEEEPISCNRQEPDLIKMVPGVKHIQFFAEKGGMIKTQDQIHGIIFKGVDKAFDSTFFASNMVEGRLFQMHDSTASKEIVISSTIASKLGLHLGDKVRTYFWQSNTYRARAFTIVGIYNTDLTDFDDHYIVGDLRQVQTLNEWKDDEVAGYEILVDNFNRLGSIYQNVACVCGYDLIVSSIQDLNPSLFGWLDLLDTNIILIIIVMALVCIVAVISALLIMIFEKTSMIGILKTIGANNKSIRNIFLLKASRIIGNGLLIGNAVALVLCLIQHYFHVIRLDSASYMMTFVPVEINPIVFLLVSAGTLIACMASLLIPASFIAKIEPAKTIRFE